MDKFTVGQTVTVIGGNKLPVTVPFKVIVVRVYEQGIVGRKWTGHESLYLNEEIQ